MEEEPLLELKQILLDFMEDQGEDGTLACRFYNELVEHLHQKEVRRLEKELSDRLARLEFMANLSQSAKDEYIEALVANSNDMGIPLSEYLYGEQ